MPFLNTKWTRFRGCAPAIVARLGAPLRRLGGEWVEEPRGQVLPLSINGFGVREAVFAFFFARLHMGLNPALTLSLGSTGLIMLFSLSGGALFLLRQHRS